MSQTARRGVAAAVRFDPTLALQLLGFLRTWPRAVKHKHGDTYGPLGLLLAADPVRRLAPGIDVPVVPQPLDDEDLAACEVFNEEWLSGACTKGDLADAITLELAEWVPELPTQWPQDVTIYQRRAGPTSS